MRQSAAQHSTAPDRDARPASADHPADARANHPAGDRSGDRASESTDAESADTARLVADATRGDEAAWETLVRLYGRRIYALAKSRLRDADAAEEIAQSVFATLAVTLRDPNGPGYAERGTFEPWLFRIAMNRVRDEGRRRQRRRGMLRLEPGAESTARDGVAGSIGMGSAAKSMADREDERTQLDAMRRALQTLDERDREIVELRHHGSLSFAQIAETLGEPIGTCLARHHRALKKLRARIEAGDEPTGGDPR